MQTCLRSARFAPNYMMESAPKRTVMALSALLTMAHGTPLSVTTGVPRTTSCWPTSVTEVPPVSGPEAGVTEVTVGASIKVTLVDDNAVWPEANVTTTCHRVFPTRV